MAVEEVTSPNLQRLRATRVKPQRGDIFAMQMVGRGYLIGRVVSHDLDRERAPMPGANLIYIYRYLRKEKGAPLDELRPDWLLLPPIFTNRAFGCITMVIVGFEKILLAR